MGRYEIHFDGMPANDNERREWHWRKRAAYDKAWRTEAALKARAAGVPGCTRIRLGAIFYRRAMGVADPRGDCSRLKQIEDGIVDAGVVPADTYRYVELGAVREERGAPGVLLIIETVEN